MRLFFYGTAASEKLFELSEPCFAAFGLFIMFHTTGKAVGSGAQNGCYISRALLARGAEAGFCWTFGHDIGNHTLQLYILDTLTAQAKFLEWWETKTQGSYETVDNLLVREQVELWFCVTVSLLSLEAVEFPNYLLKYYFPQLKLKRVDSDGWSNILLLAILNGCNALHGRGIFIFRTYKFKIVELVGIVVLYMLVMIFQKIPAGFGY